MFYIGGLRCPSFLPALAVVAVVPNEANKTDFVVNIVDNAIVSTTSNDETTPNRTIRSIDPQHGAAFVLRTWQPIHSVSRAEKTDTFGRQRSSIIGLLSDKEESHSRGTTSKHNATAVIQENQPLKEVGGERDREVAQFIRTGLPLAASIAACNVTTRIRAAHSINSTRIQPPPEASKPIGFPTNIQKASNNTTNTGRNNGVRKASRTMRTRHRDEHTHKDKNWQGHDRSSVLPPHRRKPVETRGDVKNNSRSRK